MGSLGRQHIVCFQIFFLIISLFGLGFCQSMPEEPQGPDGAILKYDLLSNSQPGINYPSEHHVGAFVPQDWPPGVVNDELQAYIPEAAVQDPNTGEITITANKDGSGYITSARLESHQVWTTAQSPEIKTRGYLEVRAQLPAKTNGDSLRGSWPAIWMLGTGNGHDWPKHGEIDIVEMSNGKPDVIMSLHSTNHHNGGPQHPPKNPFRLDTDLTMVPGIFGFEWNVREDIGQIDLTWWLTDFDGPSQQWRTQYTTKVLFIGADNDYWDFFNSFNGEGFSLLINLAEGGVFPGIYHPDEVLVDGPQYIVIKSVKVYGF